MKKKMFGIPLMLAASALCFNAAEAPVENETAAVEGGGGTPEAEGEEEVETSNQVIGNKNGVDFTRQEFKASKKAGKKSPLTGFGFPSPRFAFASQVISHFTEIAKKQNKEADLLDKNRPNLSVGEIVLLDLFHTALENKLRIKVKAGEPSFKKTEEEKAHYDAKAAKDPQKLLISIDDAYNYLPGIRELSEKALREQKMQKVKELMGTPGYGPTHPEVQKLLLEIATSLA
jgi:hypothetical protein